MTLRAWSRLASCSLGVGSAHGMLGHQLATAQTPAAVPPVDVQHPKFFVVLYEVDRSGHLTLFNNAVQFVRIVGRVARSEPGEN